MLALGIVLVLGSLAQNVLLLFVLKQIRKLEKETQVMDQTTQDAINALTAAVTTDTTMTGSLITLVQGMAATIANAATNAGASPEVLAAIKSATDAITANANQIQAAVVANTPAAPPAPAPAPTP